jgi:acetyltransferase-like isoleucine patch superfamily enzyme
MTTSTWNKMTPLSPGGSVGVSRFGPHLRWAWSRLRLLGCQRVGEGVQVWGRLWIHGEGRLVLGDRVRLDARRAPIELHSEPGASIEIGDDVLIEGGTSIEARASVVIGERTQVHAFCKILDNHFHATTGDRQAAPESAPVVIGPDADIGERCIVLPGARVGAGAAVGTAKVVRAAPPAARQSAAAKE